MAKLTLTVVSNLNSAKKDVSELTQQVRELSSAYSKISINNIATGRVDNLRKSYANLITQLKTLKTQYADGVFGRVPQDAQRVLDRLQAVREEITRTGKVTSQQQKILAQTTKQLKRYSAEVAVAKSQNDKLARDNPFTVTQAQQIPKLIKQYSSLLRTIQSTERYYPKGTFDTFKTQLQQGLTELNGLNQAFLTNQTLSETEQQTLNNLANNFNQLSASVSQTQASVKSTHGSLLEIVQGFLKFQLSAMLVMKPLQLLRSALSSINETLVATEDRVIELQRVVGDVANANELYDLAQKYGQTFENVSEATLNFARRGMSWNESLKATEAALLAINVAELDVSQATDGLGAIMAQFGIEASNLTNVVDMLNKTADNFPVTTEKILTALQRVGSTASTANLSLEETIGLITTLSKATNRSGENIGTALNSILNIAQKSSTLDTFSKLGDSVASIVEQYRGGGTSILEVLRAVSEQVQQLDTNQIFDTAEFAELNEELKEQMGEDFEMLSEIYGTAGTYRRNYFIALLNDLDTVKQVENEISNAQGYSQAENQKYLDTYTAKLNSLQAKWQDIANDEQGLLGIKKDLIDLGSGVLTIVEGVGGLKAILAVVATWVTVIVAELKGAAITVGLAKALGIITNMATLGIPNLVKQIKLAKQGIAEAGAVAKAATTTALLAFTAIGTAINSIITAVRKSREEQAALDAKNYQEQTDAIKKANDETEAVKQTTQALVVYGKQVEELRKIVDDSTSSENDKTSAQNQLLSIQNKLIESNNAYADSLNLANGNLAEQLGLLEKLTDEQLRQQAQNFLDDNNAEIKIAKSRLDSVSNNSTSTFLSGVGNDRHQFREIINAAIAGAGIDEFASLIEDNEYGYLHSYWKGVVESEDFWSGLGNLLNPFDDLWEDNGKAWTGKARAGLSFSGTTAQQIEAIEALRTYVASNSASLGLSAEQTVAFTTELDRLLDELDSDAYEQSQKLVEQAKLYQDFLNGTISRQEYLNKLLGIQEEIESTFTNNIQDVTDKYDDLIAKLEELRDANKTLLDLEEKKQDYLEAQDELLEKQNELIKAQQALENARNEATVRRYNQAMGQWEWQVDEKKVADAENDVIKAEEAVAKQEESIEKARTELENQAYTTIIEQLKDQTATNDSILKIIEEVAPLLGQDFANAVKSAILGTTSVDLDKPIDLSKPIKIPEESVSSVSTKNRWTSYQDAVDAGYANIAGASASEKARVKGQYGSYQAYLDAMYEKYMGAAPAFDSGGIANGLGYMAKATKKPEVVNAPELTAKILSPVSNAEFSRYVKDMGIMFETARQYSQSPVIERIGGATDNRVDNSGQIIFGGGLTVGADKRSSSIDELLAMSKSIPNV